MQQPEDLEIWGIFTLAAHLLANYSVDSVCTVCMFLVQCVFNFSTIKHLLIALNIVIRLERFQFRNKFGWRVHTTTVAEMPIHLTTFTHEIW